MSSNQILENLQVSQVVGALMDNEYDVLKTANALKVKVPDLKAKMNEWDDIYSGTKTIDHAVASHYNHGLSTRNYSNEGSTYGVLNTLINSTVPTEIYDKFTKAVKYNETDNILTAMMRTKVDFLKSGFRVTTKDPKKQEKINKWIESRNVADSFNTQAALSIFLNDQVAVLWTEKSKSLSVLPLSNLRVFPLHSRDEDGNPRFLTYMRIPEEVVKTIKALEKSKSKELDNFPKDWVDAAKRGRKRDPLKPLMPAGPWVELAGEGSKDKVFIRGLNGNDSTLLSPSVSTIFPPLEIRRYLQDGEFSTVFISKNFIHQVKVGAKTQGTSFRDILASRPADPTVKAAVKDAYSVVDKAILAVTGQDEEHVFHFPGSDIRFDQRYISPDMKILFWGGISLQIMTDAEGGSFSGGLIYMKSFSKKIDAARSLIAGILNIVAKGMGVEDASFKWNQNYMKEPKQVLSEMTFTVGRGMDMEMAIEQMGYDWDEWVATREKTLEPEILAKKGKPEEEWEYWQALETPFFEEKQGILSDGGRPEEDGQQTDDTSTPDAPRAGQ
jgi:hypothetical protein